MNNEITPQQLLEIAQKVEGCAKFEGDRVLIRCAPKVHKPSILRFSETGPVRDSVSYAEYEPHRDTKRGRAQLMEVVFALMVDGLNFSVVAINASKYIASINHAHGKFAIEGETKAEAILKLAHEVLCK